MNMKKILLFISMIPAYLFAGVWTKTVTEADELLGNTQAYITYAYHNGGNAFSFRTDRMDQFRIISEYVLDIRFDGHRNSCRVKVGLYDEDGKLTENFDMYLCEWNNQGTVVGTFDLGVMSNPVGQANKVKKIFRHLKGQGGYVRIVTDTYSHGRFDLRIPPVKVE